VLKLLKNLFSSNDEEENQATEKQNFLKPRLPDGVRVYVIGDIHGRLDLLHIVHQQIKNDMSQLPDGTRKIVVYLGDYIDRGSDSFGVVELLINKPIAGCESVFLKGNHESEMQSFLDNPEPNHLWTRCGGTETAFSYKVRVKAQISATDRTKELRDRLFEVIPESHRQFYASLKLSYEIGDYFMVHAGINPDLPLAMQVPEDLLWIRAPFLNYAGPFSKMIVHGHTMTAKPITLPNRISIDTGAYHSGKLTCLVLDGTTLRFLGT
jgi:serine/threonine protein phosphatase 1